MVQLRCCLEQLEDCQKLLHIDVELELSSHPWDAQRGAIRQHSPTRIRAGISKDLYIYRRLPDRGPNIMGGEGDPELEV